MFNFSLQKVNTSPEKVDELLNRGVEEVFVAENLKKKLLSGRQLRIKFGIDPTGKHIHIGRAVVLRKLKAFQELGHRIVFIVGDFTAQIGDPSDKLEKRPILSAKEIQENLATYRQQVGKILNLSRTEFRFNSEWLKKLNFQNITELAEMFSVGQMLERRNFKERYKKGEEISLREFLYPLIQGYDSFYVRADVEVAGFDQLFNLKAGRVIQKHYGLSEQDILTTTMLEGTDGRKMSTTWGNVINITDVPEDMFGKIMSLHDSLIEKYFLLCTDMSRGEIDNITKTLQEHSENPRDIKMSLAREIVSLYHGKTRAEKAEKNFIEVFQKKGLPDEIPLVLISKERFIADALVEEGVVSSKNEWRRLVSEGAIFDMEKGIKITNPNIVADTEHVLKVGKRKFIKIIPK